MGTGKATGNSRGMVGELFDAGVLGNTEIRLPDERRSAVGAVGGDVGDESTRS